MPEPQQGSASRYWGFTTKHGNRSCSSTILYWFCLEKMSIVTLPDALIKRLTASDGRILRDRILCGLCLKVGKRTRTFLIATSVSGKQFRCTIGRWPIVSVDEARALALPILQDCRRGLVPSKQLPRQLPTLVEAIANYCEAKKLKDSSRERYLSIVRTC